MDAKDSHSDWVVWRGAAVMAGIGVEFQIFQFDDLIFISPSGLESAQELWIRPREWSKCGQKLLRERAPFPWAQNFIALL